MSGWTRLVPLCVLAVAGVAGAESRAELLEGARREGKFVLYTSLSTSEVSRLLQAFEKQYPFLKAEVYRASGEKVLNKALTESRAGLFLFDVFFNTGFPAHLAQKAGLLAPYQSPEARRYPEAFRQPQGYWTGVYNNCYVSPTLADRAEPLSAEFRQLFAR